MNTMTTTRPSASTHPNTSPTQFLWVVSVALGAIPFVGLFLGLPYMSEHVVWNSDHTGLAFDSSLTAVAIAAALASAALFVARHILLRAHEMRRAGALVKYVLPASPGVRAITYGTAGAALILAALYAATQTPVTDPGLTRGVLVCAALTTFAIIPAATRYMRRLVGAAWLSAHMLVTLVGLPVLALGLSAACILTPSTGEANSWTGTSLIMAFLAGITAYLMVSLTVHNQSQKPEDEADVEPISRGIATKIVSVVYGEIPLQDRTKKVETTQNILWRLYWIAPVVLGVLASVVFSL